MNQLNHSTEDPVDWSRIWNGIGSATTEFVNREIYNWIKDGKILSQYHCNGSIEMYILYSTDPQLSESVMVDVCFKCTKLCHQFQSSYMHRAVGILNLYLNITGFVSLHISTTV